ncbi:hypothetical protein M0813_10064 [Anaeramoeba flamelloides]|uniref:PAS domain-containing protein n=1 Tax=Anaeramoeba flamelloides TaxID=1746091 RepID=A0ABQ8X7G6_9EUKA|nr:hypothetical protein M0813_10064 [Anaeramoeba flamelloides]
MGHKQTKNKKISHFQTINKQECKSYLEIISSMNNPACVIGPNYKIKMINRSFLNILGILNESTLRNKRIKKIFKKFPFLFPKYQHSLGCSNLVSVLKILGELENNGSFQFFWEMNTFQNTKVYLNVDICIISFAGKSSLQVIANEISREDFSNRTKASTQLSSSELELSDETDFEYCSELESDVQTSKSENIWICEETVETLTDDIPSSEFGSTRESFKKHRDIIKVNSISSRSCSECSVDFENSCKSFQKSSYKKKKETINHKSKIFENLSENTKEKQTNFTITSTTFINHIEKAVSTVSVN